MTDRELMQQALEALELHAKQYPHMVKGYTADAIAALRERLAREEQEPWEQFHPDMGNPFKRQEPVAHATVAGVLFDFMGWLTSRKERLVLSSADEASPAVEVITQFAAMRDLSLDDAKVLEWQQALAAPQRREWVGLTRDEVLDIEETETHPLAFYRAIEAKLKEKNI